MSSTTSSSKKPISKEEFEKTPLSEYIQRGYTRDDIAASWKEWHGDHWIPALNDSYDLLKGAKKVIGKKKIKLYHVDPEVLAVVNTMPYLEDADISLMDDQSSWRWPAITNPHIKTLEISGWRGYYRGLTLPINVESLILRNNLTKFVKVVNDFKRLKTILVIPLKSQLAQPLLNHPLVEEVVADSIKEKSLVLPSGSKIKILRLGFSNHGAGSFKLDVEKNHIEELDIFTKMRPLNCDFLPKLTKVKILHLGKIDTFDCSLLKNLKEIEELKLSWVKELINFDVLATLPKLKNLHLYDIKKIAKWLGKSTFSLKKLYLGWHIDTSFVSQLLKNTDCESLTIDDIKYVDLEDIRSPKKIKELDLRRMEISHPERLSGFAKLEKVMFFSASSSGSHIDASLVTKLPNIKQIEIELAEYKKD